MKITKLESNTDYLTITMEALLKTIPDLPGESNDLQTEQGITSPFLPE